MLHGGLFFTTEVAATLDDAGAFQWISILRQLGALFVPEDQIGEFLTEVLSETHPPRLDLPEELLYEEIGASPQPCLMFKSQKRKSKMRARLLLAYCPESRSCMLY